MAHDRRDERPHVPSLNGDMSVRAQVKTVDLHWQPSPGGEVLRKRVHRVGPPEAGQVTSLVRYAPGARFPAHDHPEGEEILVLEGVFSDEHGDWGPGSYLLNPEGFRHAPFSKAGCLIFVKLRQFAHSATARREHVELTIDALDWGPSEVEGVEHAALYERTGFPDRMRLERFAPGASRALEKIAGGSEWLVLEGGLEVDGEHLPALSWLRVPDGDSITLSSRDGCLLYRKQGGVASLRSASD